MSIVVQAKRPDRWPRGQFKSDVIFTGDQYGQAWYEES